MRIFILLFTYFLSLSIAHAQEIKSVYTSVNVDECKLIDKAKPGDGEWAQWKCDGYQDYDTYVMEGDLRYYITFDRKAEGRQTLPPFNNIGKSLEWRIRKEEKEWKPFATILRYFTDSSNGKKGQVLVVSKFDEGTTCHVAYIDALANKNANTLAHYIADRLADLFDCDKDTALIIGKSGVSPM